MNTKDFYSNINRYILNDAKEYNETNFGFLITNELENQKLSIIIKNVSNSDLDKYNINLKNLNHNNRYYGLHPSFDNKEILRILEHENIVTLSALNRYIDKNIDKFNIYSKSKFLNRALFKKVLVQSLYNFGVICVLDDSISYKEVKESWKEYNNLYVKFDDSHNRIYLLGLITNYQIKTLQEKNLFISNFEGKLYISREKKSELPIRDVITKDNIRLAFGKAYYNGVQPRLLYIKEDSNMYTSDNIKILTLYVQQTTFFTVDAFDKHRQDENALLSDEIKVIKKFFQKEYELQNELVKEINEKYRIACEHKKESKNAFTSNITLINEYLKKSRFTNIVNISACLISSDNYMILPERGSDVTDPNHLYPSVNGTSEYNDNNVSFYKESVREDYPTLSLNSDSRIDFNDELRRETIAELNVCDFVNKWSYQGITLIGDCNYNQVEKERKRFHFNVLATNSINESAENIISYAKEANESFEHKKIYMLNIKTYKNMFTWIGSTIFNFFKFLVSQESILLLIIGFASLVILKDPNSSILVKFNDFSFNDIDSSLRALITIGSLLVAIGTIIKWLILIWQRIKYKKKINLIKARCIRKSSKYYKIACSILNRINLSKLSFLNNNMTKKISNRSKSFEKLLIKSNFVRYNPVTLTLLLLYLRRISK